MSMDLNPKTKKVIFGNKLKGEQRFLVGGASKRVTSPSQQGHDKFSFYLAKSYPNEILLKTFGL